MHVPVRKNNVLPAPHCCYLPRNGGRADAWGAVPWCCGWSQDQGSDSRRCSSWRASFASPFAPHHPANRRAGSSPASAATAASEHPVKPSTHATIQLRRPFKPCRETLAAHPLQRHQVRASRGVDRRGSGVGRSIGGRQEHFDLAATALLPHGAVQQCNGVIKHGLVVFRAGSMPKRTSLRPFSIGAHCPPLFQGRWH